MIFFCSKTVHCCCLEPVCCCLKLVCCCLEPVYCCCCSEPVCCCCLEPIYCCCLEPVYRCCLEPVYCCCLEPVCCCLQLVYCCLEPVCCCFRACLLLWSAWLFSTGSTAHLTLFSGKSPFMYRFFLSYPPKIFKKSPFIVLNIFFKFLLKFFFET